MRFVSNFLMALGVVALALGGVLVYKERASRGFEQRNEAFVADFVRDFSRAWDPGAVARRLEPRLLDKLRQPPARASRRRLAAAGPVVVAEPPRLLGYREQDGAEIGAWECRLRAPAGEILLQVTLRVDETGRRVTGIRVEPPPAGKEPATP